VSAYYPHLAVAVQAALVAYVLVELARRLMRAGEWPSERWADVMLRSFALLVGAVAGALLGGASPDVGPWPVGTLLGVIAGGLCTWAVALGKRWLARKVAAGPGGP